MGLTVKDSSIPKPFVPQTLPRDSGLLINNASYDQPMAGLTQSPVRQSPAPPVPREKAVPRQLLTGPPD
jgi:hypothetical protein